MKYILDGFTIEKLSTPKKGYEYKVLDKDLFAVIGKRQNGIVSYDQRIDFSNNQEPIELTIVSSAGMDEEIVYHNVILGEKIKNVS